MSLHNSSKLKKVSHHKLNSWRVSKIKHQSKMFFVVQPLLSTLTSSSSATLDSLRAVGKTRGVNVTWIFPTSLGAGRSACFFLLFASLLQLWSKHSNVVISIPKPTSVGAYLSTQEMTYPVWPFLQLNIRLPASLSWLSVCFDCLSDSEVLAGLLSLIFHSVSVAMLPALLWFSLAQCPSFSGYCLFPPFQAEIK